MKKVAFVLFALIMVMVSCSCSVDFVEMPHNSEEYRNGNWSVDDLIKHFNDLGFYNIETEEAQYSFGEKNTEIYHVMIEDSSSNSLFTDYVKIEKGKEYGTYLKILIQTHNYIPTLRTDNCTEFADFLQLKNDTDRNNAKNKFLNSHIGEYIEFYGTITDWNDEFFYISVSLSVSIGNSNQTIFKWDNVNFSELKLEGYDFNSYSVGKIHENMEVHIIAKIVSADNQEKLEIETMEILN